MSTAIESKIYFRQAAGTARYRNILLALLNGLLGNQYLIMTTITMLLATLFPNIVGKLGGAQELGTFFLYIFFTVIGVPASVSMIITQAPLLLAFCLIIVASNANIGGSVLRPVPFFVPRTGRIPREGKDGTVVS